MDKNRYLQSLLNLRKRIMNKEKGELKLLLASYSNTKQQKDIEKRTPLIGDFFRVKINVKAFSENERKKQGL